MNDRLLLGNAVPLLLLVFVQLVQANNPAGRPTNVTLLADGRNIAVRWGPPYVANDDIRRYIVTWAILPDFTDLSSRIVLDGNATIAFITVNEDVGRVFRVRVRAENVYGVGEYSLPRYVRIGCGNDVNVFPEQPVLVTSPGYSTHKVLKTGVICTWHLNTDAVYVLQIHVSHMDLHNSTGNYENQRTSCDQTQTFVNVSNVGLFCTAEEVGRNVTTSKSSLKITLMTGLHAGGTGFSMHVKTFVIPTSVKKHKTVKSPGPPTNLKTRTTAHAIIVTWQPPIEKTLPITSYVIRYKVLPNGHAYRIVVGNAMQQFSVNTGSVEGKLLTFCVTASIGDLLGTTSKNVYVRAPCQRNIYIPPGQSVNITSPNYPHAYPSSIVCFWTLQSSPEAALRMTYYDFRLEDMEFCSSDYVKFSYKAEPLCARMNLPRSYDTGRQAINVTFVTDNINEYEGFLISFQAKAFPSYRPAISNSMNAFTSSHLLTTTVGKSPFKSSKNFTSRRPIVLDGAVSSFLRANFSHASSSQSTDSPSLVSNLVYVTSTEASSSQLRTTSSSESTLSGVALGSSSQLRGYLFNSMISFSTDSSLSSTKQLSLTSDSDKAHILYSKAGHGRILSEQIRYSVTNVPSLNITRDWLNVVSESPKTPVSFTDKIGSSTVTSSSVRETEQLVNIHTNIDSSTINKDNNTLTFDSSSSLSNTNSEAVNTETDIAGTTRSHLINNLNDSKSQSLIAGSNSKEDNWRHSEENGQNGTNVELEAVLLSVGGAVAFICLITILICLRNWRRNKVGVKRSNTYRTGHIDLYDIIQGSTASRHNSAIFKTVSSRDIFPKFKTRKRRSSFPLCYSIRKRKVHMKIQREMAELGSFIEDKEALERRLQRKYAHRRTNSC